MWIWEDRITFLNQTHSTDVVLINETNCTQEIYADAVITQSSQLALFVLTSDCLPIVLYDPMTQSIGAIHAGWKWLFGNIISKTLQKMQNQFWIKAEDLQIYIGPSISQENYEVQEDFLENIPKQYQKCASQKNNKIFFDLSAVAKIQLKEFWVRDKNIECSPYCTYRERNLFHSFRRHTHISEENYWNNAIGIYLK
jgi:YfiH family protein